jgi:hypothetical protein
MNVTMTDEWQCHIHTSSADRCSVARYTGTSTLPNTNAPTTDLQSGYNINGSGQQAADNFIDLVTQYDGPSNHNLNETLVETANLKHGEIYHIIPVSDISAYAQINWNVRQSSDSFWESFGHVMYVQPIARAKCIYRSDIFALVVRIFESLDNNNLKYTKLNTPSDFVRKHIITDGSYNIMLCNKHLMRQSRSKLGRQQRFYTKPSWLKNILMALFPRTTNKQGLPTDTPQWVLNILSQFNDSRQSAKHLPFISAAASSSTNTL